MASDIKIAVTPIKQHIGATVQFDRDALTDPAAGERCHQLLNQYHVLVFPRAGLTDAEQLAFTDILGTRIKFERTVAGGRALIPDIYKVALSNDQPEYVEGTFFWHMDGLTAGVTAPRVTILTARSVADGGGQTEFASTYAAYESLPLAEKEEIANLRVLHSAATGVRMVTDSPTADQLDRWSRAPLCEHPLVWTHESGRKSLLIGSTADRVIGKPLAAGRALLARLVEWAAQPKFGFRHDWQQGDLVIWDNRGALHRVVPYDAACGREMHRTSIE